MLQFRKVVLSSIMEAKEIALGGVSGVIKLVHSMNYFLPAIVKRDKLEDMDKSLILPLPLALWHNR